MPKLITYLALALALAATASALNLRTSGDVGTQTSPEEGPFQKKNDKVKAASKGSAEDAKSSIPKGFVNKRRMAIERRMQGRQNKIALKTDEVVDKLKAEIAALKKENADLKKRCGDKKPETATTGTSTSTSTDDKTPVDHAKDFASAAVEKAKGWGKGLSSWWNNQAGDANHKAEDKAADAGKKSAADAKDVIKKGNTDEKINIFGGGKKGNKAATKDEKNAKAEEDPKKNKKPATKDASTSTSTEDFPPLPGSSGKAPAPKSLPTKGKSYADAVKGDKAKAKEDEQKPATKDASTSTSTEDFPPLPGSSGKAPAPKPLPTKGKSYADAVKGDKAKAKEDEQKPATKDASTSTSTEVTTFPPLTKLTKEANKNTSIEENKKAAARSEAKVAKEEKKKVAVAETATQTKPKLPTNGKFKDMVRSKADDGCSIYCAQRPATSRKKGCRPIAEAGKRVTKGANQNNNHFKFCKKNCQPKTCKSAGGDDKDDDDNSDEKEDEDDDDKGKDAAAAAATANKAKAAEASAKSAKAEKAPAWVKGSKYAGAPEGEGVAMLKDKKAARNASDAGSVTTDPTPTAVDTLSSDADDGALPPVEQAEATKHIGSLAQIVKDVQELIEEERTTDAYDDMLMEQADEMLSEEEDQRDMLELFSTGLGDEIDEIDDLELPDTTADLLNMEAMIDRGLGDRDGDASVPPAAAPSVVDLLEEMEKEAGEGEGGGGGGGGENTASEAHDEL
eukprot:g1007.t1